VRHLSDPSGTPETTPADTPGIPLSIMDAAIHFNLSVSAIRKQIKAGRLRSERVARPGGWRWVVYVTPSATPEGASGAAPGAAPTATTDTPGDAPATVVADLLREALERERTAAERWQQDRAQLFGQIGYLQGELAAIRAQVLALQAPPDEPDMETVTAEKGRPWWRFW
jgi:hypothetical protein